MSVLAQWQRLQQWAERRLPALTRHRRQEELPIELHRRRIYIVPTGFGVALRGLLHNPTYARIFNVTMGVLLAACIIPIVSE